LARPTDLPFGGTFPANAASTPHVAPWPGDHPDDLPPEPAPEVPVVIDLVTGLPNAALSPFPEEMPEDADDAIGDHFPGFLELFF